MECLTLPTVLMFLPLFQGFSQLELTPMQAVAVLQRCEHRMGQKIPQADLDAGRIGQYLQPEDYKPLQDVSLTVSTVRSCILPSGVCPCSSLLYSTFSLCS